MDITFKNNLAEIMKEKGVSMAALEKMSGISAETIKKYRSGERQLHKASFETVIRIAAALECTAEDLLF